MVSFLLKVSKTCDMTGVEELFISRPKSYFIIKDDIQEFIAWGDPIEGASFRSILRSKRDINSILNNLYGHFYFILLDLVKKELIIGNSFFSILPIYYFESGDFVFFSDNSIRLGLFCNKRDLSARFVLETVLFNYPIFNHSAVEGIYLLPSNSYFAFSANKVEIVKHTFIENYFTDKPKSWCKAIPDAVKVFLSSSYKYFPEEPCFSSLTGGFDGRILAAAGYYHRCGCASYCFGTSASTDLKIASQVAAETGIPFKKIILDESYAEEQSLTNGREFILNSSGTGTFERAHYLFAAKLISEEANHIITGNFGSELFKAARTPGQMISKNLFQLFEEPDLENALRRLEASDEFNVFNRERIDVIWNDLKTDIEKLTCFSPEYSHLSKNQRFYILVFEEIFRKYFGAEIINQFKWVKNRTPLLDIDLIKFLLQTDLPGVYSKFEERRLRRRFIGQILYAEIMANTYPLLGSIMTDKGYRPTDLLSLEGKIRLTYYLLKKKIRYKPNNYDPNGVLSSWSRNKKKWIEIPLLTDLFSFSDSEMKEPDNLNESLLFRICSINYLNSILTGHET